MEWKIRWEAAEAELTQGDSLSSLDLPDLAVNALQAGWDSQSVRVLAGLSSQDNAWDLRDCFRSAVADLGRDLPVEPEVTRRLVRLHAVDIVEGVVTPRDGAREIARFFDEDHEGSLGQEISDFTALWVEHDEDWGRSAKELDAVIIDAAKGVVDDVGGHSILGDT